MRTRAIWIGSLALLLAACTHTVADTSCLAFKPITYHGKTDAPDTVAQIREHNAAWDKLCRR